MWPHLQAIRREGSSIIRGRLQFMQHLFTTANFILYGVDLHAGKNLYSTPDVALKKVLTIKRNIELFQRRIKSATDSGKYLYFAISCVHCTKFIAHPEMDRIISDNKNCDKLKILL